MYTHIYIYIYIYICIHTYIYAYIYIPDEAGATPHYTGGPASRPLPSHIGTVYIYIYICINTCVYVYIYIYIGRERERYVYVYVYVYVPSARRGSACTPLPAALGIHQRGVQSEGGAVDGGSII